MKDLKQELESFFRKKNIKVVVMTPVQADTTHAFYSKGKKKFHLVFSGLEILQNSKNPMGLISRKYKEAIGVRIQ